jgi:hypothetical protein
MPRWGELRDVMVIRDECDYHGRLEHVRSAFDPGSRIGVRVDLRPDV